MTIINNSFKASENEILHPSKIIRRKRIFLYLIPGLTILLICFSCQRPQERGKPGISDNAYLLPNGWSLSPAGREVNLGGLPLNIVVVPNDHYAVVASNGYTDHFLALVDLEKEQIVDRHLINRGWMGLDISHDGKQVYASAGAEDKILVFNIQNEKLEQAGEISLPGGTFPVGLTLGPGDKYLYVAGNHNNTFLQIDLSTNQIISTVRVGTTPYACAISSDEKRAFISNWGENSISVVDLAKQTVLEKIIVKDHPNDLILSNERDHLYVACGNWNIVSVIDTKTHEVIEEIEVALRPGAPPGSTPNALALSPDGKTLYVANADNNCIATIDISVPRKSNPLGFIPTGWYPTAIAISETSEKIIVANGKGSTSRPSGDKIGRRIHEVLEGTLSFIDKPDKLQLAGFTNQVYRNSPYSNENKKRISPPFPLGENCPIKYVFYIIKENRTYDQIFGDMEIGNGDPAYCYFPEEVTPNHHALARTFGLFDNFYHDAEVSSDGHFWSTAAYATDYVEKFWPSSYGGKGNPRLQVHDDAIAFPSSGFLWDLCLAKGITYRSYGEFARVWIPNENELPSVETLQDQRFRLSWSAEDYKKGLKIRPATPSLEGHYHPEYTGADYLLGMSDSQRFDIWVEEFHEFIEDGEMPRFTVLSLPGDHFLGTRPGFQTPRAMMAENDLILGKMVEEISRSPFWSQTAIFVIEDDPQSGPDHVDCHRTVALVISPYTQQGIVDSTMYSSSSMLRTMEEILGLPPLTQYDASATPMWNAFKSKPDLTPYTALKNRIPLDELNAKSAYGAQKSMMLPLERADAAPDDEYNRILWHAIKGKDNPFPPLKRAAFVIGNEKDNEED